MDSREHIKTLHADYPDASLAEVARVVGVSRERVRQIANSEGLQFGQPSIDRYGREHTHQHIPTSPRRAPEPALRTGGVAVTLSHTAVGTVGELLVAADLIARGWSVFWPLVRTPRCDLLVLSPDGSQVERIEVRTARRLGSEVRYARPDTSRSDRRAIVITGEPVRYSPPHDGDGVLRKRKRPPRRGNPELSSRNGGSRPTLTRGPDA